MNKDARLRKGIGDLLRISEVLKNAQFSEKHVQGVLHLIAERIEDAVAEIRRGTSHD